MLNFLGIISVMFLFCCIIPSAIAKSIFRRRGRMLSIPIIVVSGLLWGYLFSGLCMLGMLPLWQLIVAVLLNCVLCYFVTQKGYADIVREFQQRKVSMQAQDAPQAPAQINDSAPQG